MKAPISILALLLLLQSLLFAQEDSIGINRKRLTTVVVGSSITYGATLAGLHKLWYANSPAQSFRFFNDNAEWLQVDKLGHFYSAFYFSYGTSRAMRWCNVPEAKAAMIGTVTGFAIMLPIEIFDGFSRDYGASTGDLLANAAGASFFLVQQRMWKEVRIYPKFSFHRTPYAKLRPQTLGNDFASELLKDYNGHTHWLSVDADKFMPFPKWLNIAIGYSGEQMIYGHKYQNHEAGLYPYRQFYLSLDLDLQAYRTKSRLLNTLLFFGNMIKVPLPALEFSSRGTRLHAFYF